jgi:hypothetical protein
MTKMRKSIIALSLLGAVLGIASVPADAASRRQSGPVRFVDQNGGDRGYLFCKKAGIDIFDCNYFNRAQCDASLVGSRLYCVVNPWAIEQGFDPYYGTAPQAPITRRQVQRQGF